ncbi:hypothetical protein Tco_0762049, partial [Tanacetum coccineum]
MPKVFLVLLISAGANRDIIDELIQSMYILKDPSFSLANNIGAFQGEELGLTNPFEYTTYYAGD